MPALRERVCQNFEVVFSFPKPFTAGLEKKLDRIAS